MPLQLFEIFEKNIFHMPTCKSPNPQLPSNVSVTGVLTPETFKGPIFDPQGF